MHLDGDLWRLVDLGDWTHGRRPLLEAPHVTVDGNISVFSKTLQELWRRRVIVPPNLRNRKKRARTLKGTPEEIADSLGLKLGPKISSKPRPKGDYILIK
jgi:hypothetical protein